MKMNPLLIQATMPIKTRMYSIPEMVTMTNRGAMAIVFIWFGFLKVLGYSPAESLVKNLYFQTIGTWPDANVFLKSFGIFECIIGIMWMIPSLTRQVFILFLLHMVTTFLPLFYLTSETWQANFVLSLTGQYIVKNFVLIGSAITILYCNNIKNAQTIHNE